MKFFITLAAIFATSFAAHANSLAIYKGRLAKTQIYKDQELLVPRQVASAEECYVVVSLEGGGGGNLAIVFYGKDKEGKYYYQSTTSAVTARTLLDDSGKRGQAIVSRGATVATTSPARTTVFNFYADGPVTAGLPKAAKTDREWTRVLFYEEDYGWGNHDTEQNDYTYFAKGIFVLDTPVTKAANTAAEGFNAGIERVKALLRDKGHTQR